MARYRCVVCNALGAANIRLLDDRHLRVCDEHVTMEAAALVKAARPALKGSKEMYRLRATLAARTRAHPDGDHSELRRDLAFAMLYWNVEKALTEGPELTEEQKRKLLQVFEEATEAKDASKR